MVGLTDIQVIDSSIDLLLAAERDASTPSYGAGTRSRFDGSRSTRPGDRSTSTFFGVKGLKWGKRNSSRNQETVKGLSKSKVRNALTDAGARGLHKYVVDMHADLSIPANREKQAYTKARRDELAKMQYLSKTAKANRKSKQYTNDDAEWDKLKFDSDGQKRIAKSIKAGHSKQYARGMEYSKRSLLATVASVVVVDMATNGAIHKGAGAAGKAFVNKILK
jgi:hypothetical protein